MKLKSIAYYNIFLFFIYFKREITIEEYDYDGDDSAFRIKLDKNSIQKSSKKNNNNNNTGSLIDEFSNIFGMPATNNQNQNNADTRFIDGLQAASNARDVNFALSYNFANMGLGNSNRIEDRGFVKQFIDDFKLMIPYFDQPNYMKIDDKNIVYLYNSHNLHANDNAALYQQMRAELLDLGIELYLIGMQNEWSPTLRFDFRFVNGVDAVTHNTYATINVNANDRIVNFYKFVDIAWEHHRSTWLNYNIEYIPTISPSINQLTPFHFLIFLHVVCAPLFGR